MDIQHKQIENKGLFYIEKAGKVLAEMVYNMPSAKIMIIEHTEVNDELRGKNAGYQLVDTAVEYARKHHLKIIPLCPFANAVFKKKPAYADVLFKS